MFISKDSMHHFILVAKKTQNMIFQFLNSNNEGPKKIGANTARQEFS